MKARGKLKVKLRKQQKKLRAAQPSRKVTMPYGRLHGIGGALAGAVLAATVAQALTKDKTQ